MNQPTHEEISQRAHQLWEESGPAGGDANQNWLDAERELATAAAPVPLVATAAAPVPGYVANETHIAEAKIDQLTRQKKTGREPMVATHTGPKSIPAVSGKPLWNQPHSS